MRLTHYSIYAINPISSALSITGKLRLVGPLLYGKVKSSYNKIKTIMGGVKKILNANNSMLEVYTDRLKWLKSVFFANDDYFSNNKTICLMVSFFRIMAPNEFYEINKIFGYTTKTYNLNEVKEWDGEECEDNEIINMAMQEQIILLEKEHYNFMQNNLENMNYILNDVIRKARLNKLFSTPKYKFFDENFKFS
uniref:Uncharacterized protein n=1 Tax=Meloidogyne hapla TaxID=6305 RepID=A0A1I8B327_MELHA